MLAIAIKNQTKSQVLNIILLTDYLIDALVLSAATKRKSK